MKHLSFILFLFSTLLGYSQELRIENFKSLPLDVTAREKQILDVNNEPCGIIKIRSGLINVKFYSNLAIEKVESFPGEYWIWLSPGSSQLKIAVQDFPLYDFTFPVKVEKNSVYTILLIAIFPEKVIYRDTASIQPFVSFTTEPPGADVFINEVFYGKTPLKANIQNGGFNYRIEKKKFYPLIGTDSLDQKFKSLSFDIKPDPYTKRFFLLGSIGINAIPRPIFGFQTGFLGKTGFYLSSTYSFSNAKPDIEFNLDRDIIIPYVETKNIYYVPDGYDSDDKIYLLSFSSGMIKQLGKRLYFNFGFGYSARRYFVLLKKYEYVPGSNYLPGVTNYTNAYGFVSNLSYEGMNSQLGIIYRVNNNLLLCLSNTSIFRLNEFKYRNAEFHFAVGRSF